MNVKYVVRNIYHIILYKLGEKEYLVKMHQDKCKYKDSPKLTNKNL